jgi:Ser/Thr protein kinase RdoA (MazF antagonist)
MFPSNFSAVIPVCLALICVAPLPTCVFDDYPGALPSYSDRIEECATLLRDPATLPMLNAEDRRFLIRTHERLSNMLATFDILPRPIHGDAHMGNVFITPSGPLWMDFEAASRGPREWDAAGVPYLPAFHSLNPQLYAVMSKLRSVCVAVWCSALAADPDKRAAAQYQLAHLRAAANADRNTDSLFRGRKKRHRLRTLPQACP